MIKYNFNTMRTYSTMTLLTICSITCNSRYNNSKNIQNKWNQSNIYYTEIKIYKGSKDSFGLSTYYLEHMSDDEHYYIDVIMAENGNTNAQSNLSRRMLERYKSDFGFYRSLYWHNKAKNSDPTLETEGRAFFYNDNRYLEMEKYKKNILNNKIIKNLRQNYISPLDSIIEFNACIGSSKDANILYHNAMIKKDIISSQFWLTIGAQNGDKECQKILSELLTLSDDCRIKARGEFWAGNLSHLL